MYSGGIPWLTPGTPSGNTALRSPGSFFLSPSPNTSSLSMSKFSQPTKAGASASSPVINTMRCMRRITGSSALAVGGNQRREHVGARAGALRGLGIGRNHVDIAPRGGDIVVAPSRQCQQLARGVAERPARLGERIETAAHVGERRAVDQQQAGAQGRQILPVRAQRSIGGEFLIGLDRIGEPVSYTHLRAHETDSY